MQESKNLPRDFESDEEQFADQLHHDFKHAKIYEKSQKKNRVFNLKKFKINGLKCDYYKAQTVPYIGRFIADELRNKMKEREEKENDDLIMLYSERKQCEIENKSLRKSNEDEFTKNDQNELISLKTLCANKEDKQLLRFLEDCDKLRKGIGKYLHARNSDLQTYASNRKKELIQEAEIVIKDNARMLDRFWLIEDEFKKIIKVRENGGFMDYDGEHDINFYKNYLKYLKCLQTDKKKQIKIGQSFIEGLLMHLRITKNMKWKNVNNQTK